MWGLRHFGRETMIRSTCAAYSLAVQEWEKAIDARESDSVSQATGLEILPQPEDYLKTARRWAHLPGVPALQYAEGRMGKFDENWLKPEAQARLRGRPYLYTAFAGIGS